MENLNKEAVCQMIRQGNIKELISICEDGHTRQIQEIFKQIVENDRRIVRITGPSSSGKTTFAKRLAKLFDIEPLILSVDDFFYGDDEVPFKNDTDLNFFESIQAVNVPLFNICIESLVEGRVTPLPAFDFAKGKSIKNARSVRLDPGTFVFIEGTNALHEDLLSNLSREDQFLIYVHVEDISISEEERLLGEDIRLTRRSIRDKLFRGCSIKRTQVLWQGALSYEKSHIALHKKNADKLFATQLPYEPCVLGHLLQQLMDSEPDCKELEHLRKVSKVMLGFEQFSRAFVPKSSIIKEFIGDF